MNKIKWTLAILAAIVLIYVIGPKVEEPNLYLPVNEEEMPYDLHLLENYIRARELNNEDIKPDNQGRIIWADSVPQKTPLSLVYLHGWSASQEEGDPIHEEVARRYGMNLYLPRLIGHGLEKEDPMLEVTASNLMQSAREALAIGKRIGDKVLLMTTSTGGTLGLYLGAEDDKVAGLILYSPNIDMRDPASKLLNKPWGLQLARLVQGSEYYIWEVDSLPREQYWTSKYRLEALTQLRELVDVTMVERTFEKIEQPVFLGYYYKNDENQDEVVSVDAMLEMYEELSTPDSLKRKVAFPEAGKHVIASRLTSKAIDEVRTETFRFLEEVMQLRPVENEEN